MAGAALAAAVALAAPAGHAEAPTPPAPPTCGWLVASGAVLTIQPDARLDPANPAPLPTPPIDSGGRK
jgi:hypothetical protein